MMTFATKLRAYVKGTKNSNLFGAIARSKFEEPESVKEIRKEVSNKIGEQTFNELRYNSISKSLKIPKTSAKLEMGKVREGLDHTGVYTNKSYSLTKYPLKKAKTKPIANPEVEKTVKTAVEAMRNAFKKTKTTVKTQVDKSELFSVNIVDNAVKHYREQKVTVDIIKALVENINERTNSGIADLSEKNKYLTLTQQNEIVIAVMNNVSVAAEAINKEITEEGADFKIWFISDTLKETVLQAVIEKVAESTANVIADAEADTVFRSLIDLIRLYSQPKAKKQYGIEDRWVTVQPLGNMIYFVKEEVLASIIHIFGTYKFTYLLPNKRRVVYECIAVIQYIGDRLHMIEELFKKHINDSIEIEIEEQSTTMESCIPVFIAGVGNLQRLADEVKRQHKTITSAQINSLRCCLVKILETIIALVSPGEFRDKTVKICKRMEGLELG